MWMFESDFFDEHIEAVRNRAARKAYEVVEILTLLAVIIYMRLSDDMFPVLSFVVMGIIGVGSILRRYYERLGGFNSKVRREALYQLGKTHRATPYMIRQIAFTTVWLTMVSIIYVRFEGVSWYMIIIIVTTMSTIPIYGVYSTIKTELYKRPPWLKNPEEEKDLQ